MFQIIANMVPIWVQDGVMCKAPTNLKAHDQTTVSAAMAHNLHRTHNAQPSSSPQAKGPAAEALAIKYVLCYSMLCHAILRYVMLCDVRACDAMYCKFYVM